MSKEEDEQPTLPEDPLDQLIFPSDAEQTGWLLETLAEPPRANAARKVQIMRVPPCKRGKDISEVSGMLKREGQPPVTIEEMNEAVINKAAEDQERLNAAARSRRTTLGGSNQRTKEQ